MPYRRHRKFQVSREVDSASEIGYTALASFATCQLRYWLHYVEGWAAGPPQTAATKLGNAAFGRFIHGVIADLFRHPASTRTERLASSLVRRKWPDELRNRTGYKQMNRAINYITQMCVHLHPELANVLPGGVEMEVRATIGGRLLRGRIDLVVKDDVGGLILVDFKTGSQVEVPEGELYSDVTSRHIDNLPIESLITDDDFFQLRTYDYILDDFESQVKSRQLMLVNLSEAKLRKIPVTYRDRERHGESLVRLVAGLAMAEKSQVWEARHGQHCRMCPARFICPLSRGDDLDVLPSSSELEQRYLWPADR